MTSPADQRQLEKLIRKERPGLLNNLPGDKKRQLLEILSTRIDPAAPGTILTQTQVTTSPVPPAELLYGYNNAFPDGANRLFTLVENQSQHRQQLEDKITSGQLALSRRGQVFAFILAIFLTSTGTLLALKEQKEVAITIFTTTVVGLASVFIVGQWNQKRNLDQKTPKK